MYTKIYGSSDDLIEIEGQINDEIGCFNHKNPITITVSDGTKATIFYHGDWKINVLFAGDKFLQTIDAVCDDRPHKGNAVGCTPYSDVIVFEQGVEWIKIKGKTFKP